MSFANKGGHVTKVRGRTANGRQEPDDRYVDEIAAALRRSVEGSSSGAKVVASWTGANEKTVKNWLSGTYGPSGAHLVALARHSDEVLATFLALADRRHLMAALKVAVMEEDCRERAAVHAPVSCQRKSRERGRSNSRRLTACSRDANSCRDRHGTGSDRPAAVPMALPAQCWLPRRFVASARIRAGFSHWRFRSCPEHCGTGRRVPRPDAGGVAPFSRRQPPQRGGCRGNLPRLPSRPPPSPAGQSASASSFRPSGLSGSLAGRHGKGLGTRVREAFCPLLRRRREMGRSISGQLVHSRCTTAPCRLRPARFSDLDCVPSAQ